MNNENQSSGVKTKNITLSSIVAWSVGSLLLLSGVVSIFSHPLSGVFVILSSVFILPPAYKFMSEKIHMKG